MNESRRPGLKKGFLNGKKNDWMPAARLGEQREKGNKGTREVPAAQLKAE